MSSPEPSESTIVVLFTRDLRVHDHPALAEAAKLAERVVPLFVLDTTLLASDVAESQPSGVPAPVAGRPRRFAARARRARRPPRRGRPRGRRARPDSGRASRLRERRCQPVRARAGAPASAGMHGCGNRAQALPRRDDRRAPRDPAGRWRPLPKDLSLDWRLGAAPFFDLLVDGDIANNARNWQWVAGTGTDTRPNRVFNPVRQAERFDPNGDYVKRWVPELALLPGARVHTPWRLDPADGAASTTRRAS